MAEHRPKHVGNKGSLLAYRADVLLMLWKISYGGVTMTSCGPNFVLHGTQVLTVLNNRGV